LDSWWGHWDCPMTILPGVDSDFLNQGYILDV